MKIQNTILVVNISGVKINKCEQYFETKMLVFKSYDLGKRTTL